MHGAVLPPVKQPKAVAQRWRFTIWCDLALVVAMLFSTGCFHAPAPYLPTQWPATSKSLETLSDRRAHPVLQVLIAYNVYWPNHTALRLVEKDGQTLFWDPGGGFGKDTTAIVRHSDLILENAPSLIAYMPYRWSKNDQAVEIFEWTLSAAEARRMATTLRTGAGRTDYSQTGFRTATPGLFCNAAVSSFLFDHGHPSLSLGDSYLLPNLLSRELYTRHPDRVMIIQRDNRSTVLVLRPPEVHRKVAALPSSETP